MGSGWATAVIRLTLPRAEIRTVMGPGIAELMAAQGQAPAGPIFSHHLRMDPDTFDFEIGVPVTAPVSAAGRVRPGQLPAATVARTVYHGPYEGLGSAWAEYSGPLTPSDSSLLGIGREANSDMKDINSKMTAFIAVVKQWIEQMEYDNLTQCEDRRASIPNT